MRGWAVVDQSDGNTRSMFLDRGGASEEMM